MPRSGCDVLLLAAYGFGEDSGVRQLGMAKTFLQLVDWHAQDRGMYAKALAQVLLTAVFRGMFPVLQGES
ncbi:hypothetical protein PHA8399_01462 [Leisingera aquaemixtae]|uniref:Uncharacterized protein n=1 Tax=Leisingera aquaemixtae TaxID=1396826 RepID=A0A0P1H8M7_9RHOB|nr:hypothetical protein PHA8399_01462 [Leisingera aquaemixtae]